MLKSMEFAEIFTMGNHIARAVFFNARAESVAKSFSDKKQVSLKTFSDTFALALKKSALALGPALI